MRFADNFNPEWGYLAPAPSFLRTARLVVVAATIGATAGGAVVFSLIDRPAADDHSVAAHTLVEPSAAPAVTASMTQAAPPRQVDVRAGGEVAPANGSQDPPTVAAIPAVPTVNIARGSSVVDAVTTVDVAPAQKNSPRKRATRNDPPAHSGSLKGPLALLRSFTDPAPGWGQPGSGSVSSSPPRGEY